MNVPVMIPDHDLPDWILRARRGIDWGVFFALFLSVAMGWSFIVQEGLPRTNAIEHYVYRVENTAQSLHEGRLYPRWSPNTLYGYGAPIPHFYPPAPVWLPAMIEVLFTNAAVIAVRLCILLAFALAGTLVYALVLRHSDARCGLLATILYMTSPWVGLSAPHLLGDLQAVFMMALLPLWLWALDRLCARHSKLDTLILVLATSALILTDPLVAFSSVMLGGGVLLLSSRRKATLLRTSLRVLLAVAIGVGISAFYWLPAAVDAASVQWLPLDAQVQASVTFPGILAPVVASDSLALLPQQQFTLGLVLTFTTLLHVMLVVRRRDTHLFTWLTLCGIAYVLLALLMPDRVFLVGTATLYLALGNTGLLTLVAERFPRQARFLFVTSCLLAMIGSLQVWVNQQATESFGDISPQSEIAYEQQGFGFATLPAHLPIPTNIGLDTPPNAQLVNAYQTGNLSRVVVQTTIGDQIAVLSAQSHLQRYQARIQNTLESTYLLNPFVGWAAWLDGRSLPFTPSTTSSGYTLSLPVARASELVVELGSTPVTRTAWVISAISLLILGMIFAVELRRNAAATLVTSPLLTTPDLRLLMLGMFVCASIVLFALSSDNLRLRGAPGWLLTNTTEATYRSDSALQLIALDLAPSQLRAGETTNITLYWQVNRVPDENYKISLSLRDVTRGVTVYTAPLRLLGDYPSKRWRAGYYVRDTTRLTLPTDLAADRYSIVISILPCQNRNQTCDTSRAVHFFEMAGIPIGADLTLPRLLTVHP